MRFRYKCSSCDTLHTLTNKIDVQTQKLKCACEEPHFYFEGTEYTFDEIDKYEQILKQPNILNRIVKTELDKKIVGEEAARLVIFISACGRLVENCQIASFNLLVNDEAGTGKDYVTGKTLDIIPKEQYVHKTRISPTVFTYWHSKRYEPNWTWDGKVFYPEDISEIVLNSDVFKVMCSSGSSATVVIKQRAVEIEIDGKPVMITTTATATPNPELTRRFSILNLDGSEDQTKAIMQRHSQQKKLGITPEYDQDIIEAQNILRRVSVSIPFADLIDTYFPIKNVIMRTLYPRFLDYISASAAFHQFQRQRDNNGFIIAEGKDYDIAREVFKKLCSNKYMIPLTRSQKTILEGLEKLPEKPYSVSQLLTSLRIGLSDKQLQWNLRTLAKYGLIEVVEGRDEWNHETEQYRLAKGDKVNEKFEIPDFGQVSKGLEKLEKLAQGISTSFSEVTTNTSETSLTTNTSITSLTQEKMPELVAEEVRE